MQTQHKTIGSWNAHFITIKEHCVDMKLRTFVNLITKHLCMKVTSYPRKTPVHSDILTLQM